MKDLKEMTSKELKEIAKGMKISNWWNLKKAVLIEKIEEIQSMTDEEKQAIADQKAKEDAALNEYQKNWRKYTKRFNPIEFMEKFRSGKITLDNGEEIEEIEETEKPMWKKYINSDVSDEEVKALNNYDKYWNDFDQVYDPESYLNSLRNKEEKEDQPEETPEPKAEEKSVEKPKPKRGALIEFNGKSQNICKWGEELGISPNTLYGRIYKMNWSVERAFTTPSRKTK